MSRFLVIDNGAADERVQGTLSEERQIEFLSARASWAQAIEALECPPAPGQPG